MKRSLHAFTLIELLVVIAIIAILSAIMLPTASTLNDRANITTCQSHLQQVWLALRMYYEDKGAYPPDLQTLVTQRYLDDDALLLCSKTGRLFAYRPAPPGSDHTWMIASCIPYPPNKKTKRPHGFGAVVVTLRTGGKVMTVRN
jgi:prepilin-type N-terminal cleavage/methylation domain-containing protein